MYCDVGAKHCHYCPLKCKYRGLQSFRPSKLLQCRPQSPPKGDQFPTRGLTLRRGEADQGLRTQPPSGAGKAPRTRSETRVFLDTRVPPQPAATAHCGPPSRSSLASLKRGPRRPHSRARPAQGTMRGGACVGALICLSVAGLPSASADARSGLVGHGSDSWRISVNKVVQGIGSVLALGSPACAGRLGT